MPAAVEQLRRVSEALWLVGAATRQALVHAERCLPAALPLQGPAEAGIGTLEARLNQGCDIIESERGVELTVALSNDRFVEERPTSRGSLPGRGGLGITPQRKIRAAKVEPGEPIAGVQLHGTL